MTSLRGMDRWKDKTAVVIGAGSGVGAGVAAALAGAGMRVVALDRKEEAAITEALEQLKFTSSVTPRQCDVADLSQLSDTFRWLDQQHGGVHVLVNAAGLSSPGHTNDIVFNNFEETASDTEGPDSDTDPVLMCARHAVVCMRKHEIDGHIVNINSFRGNCVQPLNQELAFLKSKIKVTNICPDATSAKQSMSEDSECPAIKPADIAHAVLYALSTPPHVNVHELNIAPVIETIP